MLPNNGAYTDLIGVSVYFPAPEGEDVTLPEASACGTYAPIIILQCYLIL